MKSPAFVFLGIFLTITLATGQTPNTPSDSLNAKADITGFKDKKITGTITFTENPMVGLHISGTISGLKPNQTYAIHIHEFGSCDSTQAPGGHFDPAGSGKHGAPGLSPDARHAGDLPNITANEQGVAQVDFTTNALGVGSSKFSVIGKSVVIHAKPDDYTSQPAGAAGDRIACGVITAANQKK